MTPFRYAHADDVPDAIKLAHESGTAKRLKPRRSPAYLI